MNTIRYLLQVTVAVVILVGLSEVSHAQQTTPGPRCGQNASVRIMGVFRSGNDNYWCRCNFESGRWFEVQLVDSRSRDLFADFCMDAVNVISRKEQLARENRELAARNDSLETDLTRCRANADGCQQRFRDAALACLENTVSLVAARDACGRGVCELISYLPPFPSDSNAIEVVKAGGLVDDFKVQYDCPEKELPVIEGVNINPASAVIDPSRLR